METAGFQKAGSIPAPTMEYTLYISRRLLIKKRGDKQ